MYVSIIYDSQIMAALVLFSIQSNHELIHSFLQQIELSRQHLSHVHLVIYMDTHNGIEALAIEISVIEKIIQRAHWNSPLLGF